MDDSAGLNDLLVRVRATATGWSSDVKAIQRDAKGLEKAFKPIQEQAKAFGLALTAIGSAVTAAFGVMVKATAEYGSQINKANIQTGIATEQLSKLKFAADQSETSFEGVALGLKFLARNAAEAANGSKAQAAAFRDIGISVKDSSGALRPMNDLLLDVADQFKGMEDGTAKVAMAQKIFGKSGLDLIPILNEGREGILKMGNEAERLGLVISGDAAKAADEFDDTLTQVKAATLGLANSVGQALLPALTKLAGGARDSIAAFSGFAKEHENLTLAIGGTAAALAGTGGLMVWLALVVSIAPKVVAGLRAIAAAAIFAQAAIVDAGAAFTILKGISLSELPVALELIGGASVIATTGLVGLAAGVGYLAGRLLNAAISGTVFEKAVDSFTHQVLLRTGQIRDSVRAPNELSAATQKLSDDLAKQGIIIDRGSDSLAEWNKRVIDAARGSEGFRKALGNASGKELQDIQEFFKNSSPVMTTTGKVLKEIWEKADAAAEIFNKKLTAQMELFKENLKALEEYVDFWRKALAEFKNQTFAGGEEVKAGLAASEATAKAIIALDKEHLKLLNEAGDELIKQQEFWDKQLEEFKNRTFGGGADVKAGEEAADKAAKAGIEANTKILKSGQDAINQISGDISRMFTGMIANGQSFWSAFKNLGKSAAAALADTFLSTMIHSFLDPFAKKFGEWIGSFKNKIGELGDFLKKNLSSVALVTGGAAIGGAVGGTRGAIAGGAAGLAADQLLKGNWIAGAIAGVAALGVALSGLFGSLRKQADKFVQTIQNPMTDAVSKLFDSLNAAKEAGTLTVEQAQLAKASLEDMWSKFQESAAGAGIVGQQALATMNQYIPQWREWFDAIAVGAKDSEDAARALGLLAEQAENIAGIIDRVKNATQGAADLAIAIQRLQGEGVPAANIIEVLGGEIKSVTELMLRLGQNVPPAISGLYDLMSAISEIANINSELTDTFGQLGDALNSTLDQIDSGLSQSLRNVEDWTQQLRDKTRSTEQNRLQSIIDTASDISTYYRTKNELKEFNRRIEAEQAAADRNSIEALRSNIALEQERIQMLQREHDTIAQLMDAAGIARLSENDQIVANINALILRGTTLEQERDRLNEVIGAAQSASHVFAGLADILAGFSLKELSNPSVEMPQYDASGGSYIPYASVTPAVAATASSDQGQQSGNWGGTVTINQTINAKVIDKQTVEYMHSELDKLIRNYGFRPLTGKVGR